MLRGLSLRVWVRVQVGEVEAGDDDRRRLDHAGAALGEPDLNDGRVLPIELELFSPTRRHLVREAGFALRRLDHRKPPGLPAVRRRRPTGGRDRALDPLPRNQIGPQGADGTAALDEARQVARSFRALTAGAS